MCSITMALTGLMTGMQMMSSAVSPLRENAKLQNRQGELIAEQYGQKQRELDNRRRLVQGAQRAEAGASGIAGGMGTAMDTQVATTNAWQEDSENLLGNQREAVYNNYIKEVNYRNQAESYRAQAAAAKRAGSMAQWGTLLSGAASLYGLKTASGTSAAAKSTSAGIASTPTAAGYVAQASDNMMKGVNTMGFNLPAQTKIGLGGIALKPQKVYDFGWTPTKNLYTFGG